MIELKNKKEEKIGMIFSSLRIRDNSKNQIGVFTEDFPKTVII